jgi:hypothetical protein
MVDLLTTQTVIADEGRPSTSFVDARSENVAGGAGSPGQARGHEPRHNGWDRTWVNDFDHWYQKLSMKRRYNQTACRMITGGSR